MEQPDFFDQLSMPPPSAPAKKLSLAERCAAFDREHPEVYAEIVRLALAAVRAGRKRIGIGHIVEVARWNLETTAKDGQGFKLNNSFRRTWAERLVRDVPELVGKIEFREKRERKVA